LPAGVVGLVIAAVLAAAMSTLSSSLNSSATAFVARLLPSLRPDRSEADYLRVSRGMTLFWGVAQMGVALTALYIDSRQSVVDQVLRVASLTTGIVLGLFLLGSLPRRVSSTAALAGMAIGLLVVLGVWLPEAWGRPLLAWPWYAPVGAFTTVAAALLLSALGVAAPRAGASDSRLSP
jgi:Na+/proline symporter